MMRVFCLGRGGGGGGGLHKSQLYHVDNSNNSTGEGDDKDKGTCLGTS